MFRSSASLLVALLLCQCQGYPPYPQAPQAQTMAPIFGAQTAAHPGRKPGLARPAATSRTPPSKPPANNSRTPHFPAYPDHPDPAPQTVPLSWRVEQVSSPRPLAGAAAHYEVRVVSAPDQVKLSLVVFDSRRCRLRVIDQPDPRAGGGAITHLMRAHAAVAGVNGGFFTPDFRPLGLVISDRRVIGSFQRSGLISGLALQLGDQPYLIWNSEYQGHSGVADLLQSGPRLLDSGRPVAGLENAKKRARSFIATDGAFLWAIGISEPCSLAALAGALAAPGTLPGLTPLRALNLDGGNSSALWMRTAEGKEISRPGWSTVRNYLAVVAR